MSVIKVFGLPRSCTNITEVLLRTNFKVRVINNFPCWKHGENTHEGRSIHDEQRNIHTDELKFIICKKHPFDWLWSMYTFEKRKETPSEFIRIEGFRHYKKSNPIDIFNKLMKHWLTMYKDSSILISVKQEDLAAGQILILEKIRDNFDLIMKGEELIEVNKRINPGRKTDQKAYTPKKVDFSEKDLEYIVDRLNKKTVKLAGYEL